MLVSLRVSGSLDVKSDLFTALTIGGLIVGATIGLAFSDRLRVSDHPQAEAAKTAICVVSALAVPFLLALAAVIAFVQWFDNYQF